jgi:uncharacterized membrane protein (UPF0127 family)
MTTSDRNHPGQHENGCWLVRDGKVLASLEVPSSRRGRARGLLGRDNFEGAILLQRARSVHTIGMRFDLDIALLDASNVVIKTLRLRRNRISGPIFRARAVLEAETGAFGLWDLKIGDQLEIRE